MIDRDNPIDIIKENAKTISKTPNEPNDTILCDSGSRGTIEYRLTQPKTNRESTPRNRLNTYENVIIPRKEETKKNEESLCFLCYLNAADSVMLPCSHGGICYTCCTMLSKQEHK